MTKERRAGHSLDRSHEPRIHAHKLHEEGIRVEQSITILKPAEELFAFWRDFRNLPKFMRHLREIQPISALRSHWVWETIAGVRLEWDTEIIAEIQDRMISWQTVSDSLVISAGSVWFRAAPQDQATDQATEVHVQLLYRVPGGKLTKKIAELLGQEPSQILHEDLRRLRFIMEAGEVPTTKGQPHGSSGAVH